MKKKFLIVAAAFIGSQLSAQQDTSLLDEVVITANKYPNKTSLTGKVVTIITREQLERSGGKDLSQLLTEQVEFTSVAPIAMQVRIKVCTCVVQELIIH